jgi:hypothetical protein
VPCMAEFFGMKPATHACVQLPCVTLPLEALTSNG